MKSPTALAYLFGNPLSFLAILGATLFVGYEALAGQASGWLAIILVVIFGFSLKCQNYLSSYGRWKREWDAMNGQQPKPSALASMSLLRYPVGIVAWIFGAVMALAAGNHPEEQWAGNVFWWVSVLGFANLLWRIAKAARRPTTKTNGSVGICPAVPMQSANVAECCRSLPPYCLDLLRH